MGKDSAATVGASHAVLSNHAQAHSRFKRPSSQRAFLRQRKRQSGVENRVDTRVEHLRGSLHYRLTGTVHWVTAHAGR